MSTLFIHNVNILSFHKNFVKGKNTIVINGNKISAVGKFEELKPLIHPATKMIDAAGKTLMPGFNDTHIHIWKVGNLKTFMLDVRAAKSLDEMLSMLENYYKSNPDIAWVTARGFNEAAWQTGKLPTKDDLDKVIKDKPVYVIRTCAHIAVANSKALEISGITSKTIVPEGGEVHTNSNGQPNGIFAENALGLITKHIPAYTKNELKLMVKAARNEMYSYGITSATDPAVDPLLLQTYHEMNDAGELQFRLNALPILLPDGGENPYLLPESFSSDFLNVNTVKFFSDGGLSGKTSALKKHYKNSDEKGVLRLKREQYSRLCISAMEKGFGIATHAIGDAAIEFVIDVYKQLHKDFPSAIKRIEHLGLPEKKHLSEMADNNIAASMQSIFISELGKNFIRYLDEDYLNHCYPIKSVMQHGILTALSSDAPVVKDFNPLKGIEAAVTRRTNEGSLIAAAEAISKEDALKAYTINASAISNTNNSGTIEPGKWADFILLNKNPLTTPVEEITTVEVEETFVGGQRVWKRH
ncbi:MAG TPA: amidohydrolase [Puia sp.]|nr:amidohydrolase [Puia sp.]